MVRIGNPRSLVLEWLHLFGDPVSIILGSMPLVIAAISGWLGGRFAGRAEDHLMTARGISHTTQWLAQIAEHVEDIKE